jgi:phosphatidylglycerophosphate synthase
LEPQKKSFTEIQKFNQWWLWVILTGLLLLPVYGIYKQVFGGQPWGSNPMSDIGLWIFLLGTLAFILFFLYMELRTEIDERGIRVRLRPIARNVFAWDQVEKVELITYGFVGYGLRFSFKYGTVYNVRGNKGLAVYLKDGGRFVIGTQREADLVQCLKSLDKLS